MVSIKELKTTAGKIRQAEPKISAPEIYLLLAFALVADAVNWIPIINWFVTIVTLPGYWLYFKLKGVSGVWSMTGNLVELIPVVSIVPAITFGVLATILIDHFAPGELKKALSKLGGKK